MKPYLLVACNYLRFSLIKILYCKQYTFKAIEMLSWKTRIKLKKGSRVSFGRHLVSDGHGTFIVDENGFLTIGDCVYFNENVMISCKGTINIGSGCYFGPNVKIFDNDHKYDPVNGVSAEHTVGSIQIGENCWIATNVVILKETRIGKNSVIGAGCVVSGIIPDGSLVTQSRELTIRKIEDTSK